MESFGLEKLAGTFKSKYSPCTAKATTNPCPYMCHICLFKHLRRWGLHQCQGRTILSISNLNLSWHTVQVSLQVPQLCTRFLQLLPVSRRSGLLPSPTACPSSQSVLSLPTCSPRFQLRPSRFPPAPPGNPTPTDIPQLLPPGAPVPPIFPQVSPAPAPGASRPGPAPAPPLPVPSRPAPRNAALGAGRTGTGGLRRSGAMSGHDGGMSSRDSVQIPDDRDFGAFRAQCESEQGWSLTYSKGGVGVWVQLLEPERALHKIKCRMECRDVPAETLYDVLHDIEYRKKWDTNVIETFDIGRLTANSDVGYYAWRCPKPLKNRDVVTLRSWLPIGSDYIIMNYSVKHPKYPPRKDMVRAVSIQTGYLIEGTGAKSCTITYLAQVDPKGSLPKWVVNKSSQFLAPKAMKKMYKACLKYPEWKQKHDPHFKPWLFPEQSRLPALALSELSLQHADSLENIDESSLAESKEERGDGSDEDSLT